MYNCFGIKYGLFEDFKEKKEYEKIWKQGYSFISCTSQQVNTGHGYDCGCTYSRHDLDAENISYCAGLGEEKEGEGSPSKSGKQEWLSLLCGI